ncbi:uncharacterized protein LOC116803152 [Drosophila sechellia]|nr:uncharacterized protein LOC116803152 [Drosophila sechellia]
MPHLIKRLFHVQKYADCSKLVLVGCVTYLRQFHQAGCIPCEGPFRMITFWDFLYRMAKEGRALHDPSPQLRIERKLVARNHIDNRHNEIRLRFQDKSTTHITDKEQVDLCACVLEYLQTTTRALRYVRRISTVGELS